MADADTTLSDDEFCRLVAYSWNKKRDLSSFIGWSDKRCAELMPRTYLAWQQMVFYESIVDDAVKELAI